MKHTNFRGKDIKGQDFKGKDLTGSNFREADISGCDFTGAILHFCNFKDSTQEDTIFKDAKVKFSVGILDISDADNETEPVKSDEELAMEAEMEARFKEEAVGLEKPTKKPTKKK